MEAQPGQSKTALLFIFATTTSRAMPTMRTSTFASETALSNPRTTKTAIPPARTVGLTSRQTTIVSASDAIKATMALRNQGKGSRL